VQRQQKSLFDQLVGSDDQQLRDLQAECLRGREIDDQIEQVGCSTGMSEGLAPRNILSMYSAPRRYKSS